MYTCKNCLSNFNHRASYEKHWAEGHRTWSCPECELDLARQKKTIYNHMKKCHKRRSRLPRPEPMRRPRISTNNDYNEDGKKKGRLEEEPRPSTSRDTPKPSPPTDTPRPSASTSSAESGAQNSITLRPNIVLGQQESPDQGSPSPIMIDEEDPRPIIIKLVHRRPGDHQLHQRQDDLYRGRKLEPTRRPQPRGPACPRPPE